MKPIESFDWEQVARELNSQGNAVLERLLSADECGLPPPFDAARRSPRASIGSLKHSPPSTQPLCVHSQISTRSWSEMATWNHSR